MLLLMLSTCVGGLTSRVNNKGDGDSLKALLESNQDKVVFAIVRTTEKIDESVTTKFAFVNFQGPQVRERKRGRVSR
jgi:hypothetical protein